MSAALAIVGWLVLLPVILGSNWLRARYGGGDYPLWYLIGAWLLVGVLFGVNVVQVLRRDRRSVR